MIRPYNKNDQEQLVAIFLRNVPKFFDPKEVEDFKQYLEVYGTTYFSIEQHQEIVGGVGYYVNTRDKSGRIAWIFFDPNYAGKGLGRYAVNHCLQLLRQDIRLEKFVVTTSQWAYTFFEKFGYQTVRIEKEYWGKGLDLYEMEMPNL